ncbi:MULTISPECIES: hypothetical protein [Streptomyces]|uniref:hypothetical protein n=1 Tax=Streptomyces TaxID=1883 RepID=UPI00093E6329|nr:MULTISPECIES: hypothetical protein [Streptomyces]MBP2584194.1 hypothetical protein [Streptomyces sp. PvR006]MCX5228150.1 hypothetical protein [Streptomyces sp. NBC_00233]
MLLHEFRPGRMIAGLTALALAGLYAGDATGAWTTPWYVVFPVLFGGLGTAGLVTWIVYRVRRRSARSRSSDSTDAPASTSGSQAIR